jgi:nitrogen fixation NifU-like protein
MASASLLTQTVIGCDSNDLQIIFDDFNQLVTQGPSDHLNNKLGKLAALGGVAEFPSRVKCATLVWHAATSAFKEDHDQVTTE